MAEIASVGKERKSEGEREFSTASWLALALIRIHVFTLVYTKVKNLPERSQHNRRFVMLYQCPTLPSVPPPTTTTTREFSSHSIISYEYDDGDDAGTVKNVNEPLRNMRSRLHVGVFY